MIAQHFRRALARRATAASLGVLALALSSASLAQQAKSPIELASASKIEKTVKQADGSTVRKLVDAKSAAPGDEVVFVNTFKNNGQQAAGNLSLVNPIPANTFLKTAFGDKATITYSLDGGKSFDAIEKLTVTSADGKVRAARLDDSTHVRWVLAANLPAGQSGEVGFRVQVK
jgi:uncharacterized repeat protein (TIGR01451 family)